MGKLHEKGGIDRGSTGTGSITSWWRKIRVTGRNPKFILITQPMDGIYGAIF